MLKIFFLPGAYDGCYFYRGYLPAIYGNMTCMTEFVQQSWDKDLMHKRTLEADVVVIQRPNDGYRVELMKALKQKGKFIVFDNDDTYLPGKGVPLNMLGSDKARELAIHLSDNLNKALKIADLVIASTHVLAEEYRQTATCPVVVCKNTIDPLDEYPRRRVPGKTRIGFIGSVASNDDYIHVKDVIRALDASNDVTFVVLGNPQNNSNYKGYEKDNAFWQTVKNIEWHEFVPATRYHKKLADLALDIALIPRKDNYFNRCKSNIKFVECSLARIPVIAQGFTNKDSPYQDGKDKKYMQVITDDKDWLPAIKNTIKNYDQYATLADRAHNYVLEHYNIKKYAKEWRQIIEQHYANRH